MKLAGGFLANVINAVGVLLTSKTPKTGKKIRNVGLALLGVAAVPDVALASGLPEIPGSWLQMAQIITGLVGMILTFMGQSQTSGDIDQMINKPKGDFDNV